MSLANPMNPKRRNRDRTEELVEFTRWAQEAADEARANLDFFGFRIVEIEGMPEDMVAMVPSRPFELEQEPRAMALARNIGRQRNAPTILEGGLKGAPKPQKPPKRKP